MPDIRLEAMTQLYSDLAAETAALDVTCDGCGRCCRFDEAGHIVYASGLERRYLAEKALPPPDSPAGAPADLLAKGLRCPYQVAEICLARDGRALGCRLYFCRWPDPEAEEVFYRKWHDRLKRLHYKLDEPWDYRPLLPLDKRKKGIDIPDENDMILS